MKILYQVVIADGFHIGHFPLPWPIADGEWESKDIDIEFEPTTGDNMKDADAALSSHIKINYPNKEYKIYYWWWL